MDMCNECGAECGYSIIYIAGWKHMRRGGSANSICTPCMERLGNYLAGIHNANVVSLRRVGGHWLFIHPFIDPNSNPDIADEVDGYDMALYELYIEFSKHVNGFNENQD